MFSPEIPGGGAICRRGNLREAKFIWKGELLCIVINAERNSIIMLFSVHTAGERFLILYLFNLIRRIKIHLEDTGMESTDTVSFHLPRKYFIGKILCVTALALFLCGIYQVTNVG